jgi:diaminohydroxyphosphoribosylaminopyrimidine deaminase/5-amino-6-(5-phosphoribosylamino)uracil reductase
VFSAIDHALMARALRLAEQGLATTQPNPRVGCVMAQGEDVVGEGWHQRAGGPHAEIFALRAAGPLAKGATAYVTLEPCGRIGRTPPCADALIAAGIARVVIASEDAFQRGGGALDRLRAAGIAIETGLMRDDARELNRGFFSRVERGRPWLRIKLATSLDGRTALANGESKWITGEAARADVQRWRARSSAILTGAGTARVDNPRLTVRVGKDAPVNSEEPGAAEAVEPLRVVLDTRFVLPAGAHLLDGSAPTLVLHAGSVRADARHAKVETAAVEMRGDRLDLGAVMTLLAARGVNELQVEAGPVLCGALFEGGLVDELLLYMAPILLGDRAKGLLTLPLLETMAARKELRVIDRREIGEDMRLLLRPCADSKAE